MTRKDYVLLAEELKAAKGFVEHDHDSKEYNQGKYDAWFLTVSQITGRLARENPHFDPERFLKACGVIA